VVAFGREWKRGADDVGLLQVLNADSREICLRIQRFTRYIRYLI
jgi:hypothetical protein